MKTQSRDLPRPALGLALTRVRGSVPAVRPSPPSACRLHEVLPAKSQEPSGHRSVYLTQRGNRMAVLHCRHFAGERIVNHEAGALTPVKRMGCCHCGSHHKSNVLSCCAGEMGAVLGSWTQSSVQFPPAAYTEAHGHDNLHVRCPWALNSS